MTAPRSFLLEGSKLPEARIQFALKCMRTVIQKKGSENVVFSPYNIYEGLLMVYFASSGDTEIHLRRILQLPESISKEDWILYHQWDINKTNRAEAKGYYDENICWIQWKGKPIKDIVPNVLNRKKWCLFECSNISKYMRIINEELKNEMQDYIRNPVEFNILNENMDFILSSVLRCRGKISEPVSKNLVPKKWLRKPTTVLSSKLGTFMTEIPYINMTHSMFLLFPAVQSDQDPYKWEIDHQSISGLIERLTTEEGTDELRKVLDYPPQPPIEGLVLPENFYLEYDLSIDELLQDLGIQELLEPDNSSLSNFSDDLHLGGAMYRAYVRVSSTHVTAGAINIFFTKNEGSFKSIEETKHSQYEQSFVWLIYDRLCHTILFVGIINKNCNLP